MLREGHFMFSKENLLRAAWLQIIYKKATKKNKKQKESAAWTANFLVKCVLPYEVYVTGRT